MKRYPAPVHRTILIADVQNFGDPARTNPDQVAVRDGMYRAIAHAFAKTKVDRADYSASDRGDGVLALVSADVPKSRLVSRLPRILAAELIRENAHREIPAQFRMRLAVHAGEIHPDAHGVTGASINLATRLVEASALKSALASCGILGLVVSEWFFDEVVRHDTAAEPSTFRRVPVDVKETHTTAWIRVFGES
jgi:class 3 adenylate cyclase